MNPGSAWLSFLHQIEPFRIDATENQQKGHKVGETRETCTMLAVLQWGVQAPKGHDDASCIQSATENVISCHHYTVQGAHCNACKLKENNIWWTCPLLEGLFVTTSSFAQTDTFYVCILHLSSSFSSKHLLNSQLRTNNGFIVLLTTSKHVTCLKPWEWHLNHWRRHPHSPIPSLPNSASCKHPETSEAPFPTQKPRAGPNVPWHPGAGDLFLRSHLTKQGNSAGMYGKQIQQIHHCTTISRGEILIIVSATVTVIAIAIFLH